jgi:4-hydroxy-tetrahydrodipicolinate reductase
MKLALIGYGKMGKAIADLATQRGHEIAQIIGSTNLDWLANMNPQAVDVALEFSEPAAAYHNIYQCLSQGIPVISGTTGWLQHRKDIEQYCLAQGGTFFYASNFSIGAHIFFKLNQLLAKLMSQQENYRVSIEEIHHMSKKDAPSGTAITLAEGILQHISSKKQWGDESSEQEDTIPIYSRRLPNVAGTHMVTYASTVDTLSIQHTAHSRQGFALGALLIAEWLHEPRKKGVLGMDDFLAW